MKHPPGSTDARAAGCKCPVIDNCRGRGIGGDGEKFGWVMSMECDYHRADTTRLSSPGIPDS